MIPSYHRRQDGGNSPTVEIEIAHEHAQRAELLLECDEEDTVGAYGPPEFNVKLATAHAMLAQFHLNVAALERGRRPTYK